jgi:protein-tyrosine phosphatase
MPATVTGITRYMADEPAAFGRDLGLAGLPNARDLGGHRTSTGAVLRSGVLFRADAPAKATGTDLSALRALGVVQVIDLRGASEIEAFGIGTWGAPRIHLPVSDTGRGILAQLAAAGDFADASTARRMMTESYRQFVSDRQACDRFGTAVRLIAAPGGVPALFHCTAGKDRTGWLAAIILTALGVDRKAVTADYMMSNIRFTTGRGAAGRQELLTSLHTFVSDVRLVTPVLNADPSYLSAAFDEAQRIYGSFDAFLHEGLRLDVTQLRRNLLCPAAPGHAEGESAV